MAVRWSYTKEEREAVLVDVPALGINAAARKHGVPQTTPTKWAQAAGVRREVEPPPSSAPRAKRVARKSKEGSRSGRKRKEAAAHMVAEPAAAGQAEQAKVAATAEVKGEAPAATMQPPARRPLKKRVAMIYTPSQKG